MDGTYPSGTTKWEKRNISQFVPVWEPEICIQCGNCSFVCPHGVIRSKLYDKSLLADAPEGFMSTPIEARGFPRHALHSANLCRGLHRLHLCVEVCPAKSKEETGKKAINMSWKEPILERRGPTSPFRDAAGERSVLRRLLDYPRHPFLEPLFEFSGACAGCGETPYIKLVSQLFGDRMMVANATGCSSIYGGNLPTTPWTVNSEGRGPSWSNSLFEDNAEFGLGMARRRPAHGARPQASAGDDIRDRRRTSRGDLTAPQRTESEIRRQRQRVAELKGILAWQGNDGGKAASLGRRPPGEALGLVHRRRRLGLRHRLVGSGPRDVDGPRREHLVLDTEVYSNTGGQASKSTPIGAVAKFANAASQSARRTSRCKRSPTATSTSPASRWAPTRSRRCSRCARRKPTQDRR